MLRNKLCFSLAATVILFCGGGTWGYSWYRSIRLDDLDRKARAALEAGDLVEASLAARRALQLSVDRHSTAEILAEIYDKASDPVAVTWRKRAAALSNDSPASLCALAMTALRFDQKTAARSALDRIRVADRKGASYHSAAGAVALVTGDFADAVTNYTAAARMEPAVVAHCYYLAKAQVESVDFVTQNAGRRTLSELADDTKFGQASLRDLVVNLDACGERHAAIKESGRLIARPDHTFEDELVHLGLLHKTADERFAPNLTAIQKRAAGLPSDAAKLVMWMNSAEMSEEAIEWVKSDLHGLAESPEMQHAIAEIHLALQRWNDLLEITQDGKWGEMEFVRCAYRARALRENGDALLASSEWKTAVTSASGRFTALEWLSNTALTWNWPDEADQALWNALETTVGAEGTLQKLYQRYLATQNTDGLWRLASHVARTQPKNGDARNDFAMLSLLLGKETERAARTAFELFHENPDNPNYASTYAFALHKQGKPKEALHILSALPRDRLKEPAFAAYYGIALAAADKSAEARKFLEIGAEARLLPEEKRLLANAMAHINQVGGSVY